MKHLLFSAVLLGLVACGADGSGFLGRKHSPTPTPTATPTPFPTPSPTPSPSSTPSATPSPSQTPTPTPSSTNTPSPTATPTSPTPTPASGLYEIGGDALTNPNISGLRAETKWSIANPADGQWDWSRIDALVANAQKNGKQISLSLQTLNQPPTWLKAPTYKAPQGPDPMVLPWDPIVQPKLIAFITALCQHFDGKLSYLYIGGVGYKNESYMPLPSEIGLDMSLTDYGNAWVKSCDLIIYTYGANLTKTPFILAAGVPFSSPGFDSTALLKSVVDYGLTYQLFGLAQWGLKPGSNNGFVINKWIQDNSATHVVGFQDYSGGKGNSDLAGTLLAGQSLGAHWIELYAVDCMNPIYAALLAQYNQSLK